MKKYSILIILGLSIIVTIQAMGQSIILNNDTIPVEKDSLFLTIPSDYRGISTWQQSTDGKEWHSLKSTTGDSLFVHSFFDSYYRVKIEEGTCVDIYSDTVKMIKDENVITIQNDSLFEYASLDSVGENEFFLLGTDTLVCEKINGEYYYQGDIIINPEQIIDTTGLKGAAIPYETRLWPNKEVYYYNPNMKGDRRIIDAIKYFDEKTTLRFYELDKTTINNHNNFIEFVPHDSICSSPVGMQEKAQEIKIAKRGKKGNVIHEIGHAIGLYHEQSRSDRNNYINVHEKNILPGKENNFNVQNNTINIPSYDFDFESIMLYSSNAFAIDFNKPTITKKDGTEFFAQRSYLSKFDILTVKKLYPVKPDISTFIPDNITSSSVTCGGKILDDGGREITDIVLCWSTNYYFTVDNNYVSVKQSANIFSKSIHDLKPNTKYYIKAFATNEKGTSYGPVMPFTTLLAFPEVTTGSVSEKTYSSATIIGNFTTDGGSTISVRGVCWNTEGNPNIADSKTTDGSGTGSWGSELVELQPNTTYYIRAYATNSEGTAYGEQKEFTTLEETVTDWPRDTETAVVDVTNLATGKTWMDRNLGASRAATSNTDEQAYGDLYQWGRAADGHEKRNSNTTLTLSTTDTPGHGNFILASESPYDWRSPQNNNLWQGVNGTNNPCPSGYRLPTIAELDSELQSWSSNNADGAFASPLKLPVAGLRNVFNAGSLDHVGSEGTYWSSTVGGDIASQNLYFGSSYAGMAINDYHRALGLSVRCLKDSEISASLPSVTTANATSINQTIASCGGDITSDGGATVTARGVCWNTTGSPDITDSKTTDGSGTGSWASELTELQPNTTYYVRAYATNSEGTAYGEQKEFTTLEETVTDWPRDTETAVVDVTNPATGKTWMDRNLGASRAATTNDDEQAYGDLYQWGRAADGHQKRNSNTTSTLSTTDIPGHGNFILAPNSPDDWRSPQNDNLWQGVSGTNNPCPSGYRLPTEAEWEAERISWGSNDIAGAFASPLKLPVAGYRFRNNGSLYLVSSRGYWSSTVGGGGYWSSTVGGTGSRYLHFRSDDAYVYGRSRADGYSVRCLKDSEISASLPSVTTANATSINQTTASCGGDITSDGGVTVTARGVCWNTTGSPDITDNKTADGSGTGSWASELTELQPNTTYYVRAYASNSAGTSYGEEISFTTAQISIPEIQTLTPSEVSHDFVILNANVSSDGGAAIEERGFYLCEGDSAPDNNDRVEIVEGTTGNYSKKITGLKPSTTYSYSAFAFNSEGTSVSVYNLFATDAIPQVNAPEITTPNNFAVFNRNNTASINIQWSSVNNADEYWLNVFPSGQPASPVFNESVGSVTNKEVSISSLQNGVYLVQVKAAASGGEWSNYLQPMEFIADTPPDAPVLSAPGNEAEITQNTQQSFNWEAPSADINRYFVRIVNGTDFNGTPVYDDELTTTSQSIDCNWPAGTYTWSVRAIKNTPEDYAPTEYENTIGWGAYATTQEFIIKAETTLPAVTTANVTSITQTTASCGGDITSDGGATVTARGVCWNTAGSPDIINNSKTTDGSGTGSWASELVELQPNTTYYVRAYATNSEGTAYGSQLSFTTLAESGGGETAVVEVISPTGRIWMDRNLGATQVATSSTDAASYGDLYQWGRAADGHEKRTSSTTSTLSSSDTPGHGNFILAPNSPYDWRSPQNDILWQGANGTNNPCPSGYRLPTAAEWDAERISWDYSATGAIDSPLKLPDAGDRSYSTGSLSRGRAGFYWSSTVDGTRAQRLAFYGGGDDAGINRLSRASGYSVRCIKDAETTGSVPTVTTDEVTDIAQITATGCGNVTDDGGAYVLARGIVWSTSENPTVETNQGITTDGSGTGAFTSSLIVPTAETTYYVRAYATNNAGTSYGMQVNFTTLAETSEGDVTNPTTGLTWMDRNLGALREATSSTDANAYGDLYQWGRGTDGHEKRNSATTSTLSSSDTPGHGNFILASNSPDDWRSPQNDNLWQGVSGTNNPCPSGYRLPTEAEWEAERTSWSSNDAAGAFASPLKLPVAGDRSSSSGSLYGVGSGGNYWSSTVDGTNSRCWSFNSYGALMHSYRRALGHSVRCLKDSEISASLPSVTTANVTSITQTTASCGGDVTSDGGATVTARGVCWNTSGSPDITDNKTSDGSGTGSWVSELTELQPNTTYYVRAYATNSEGTAYGEQREITTLEETVTDWPRDTETEVVDVTNPATGKTWMDRNLGASRAATSSTDAEAYGDLYQWGRAADDHQKRYSNTTSTLSTTNTPGHGNFILASESPYDWRSPQNNNLWQGVSGTNNPCPSGYRLPTFAELDAERKSWNSNNADGAFVSPLKLSVAGSRSHFGGALDFVGSYGLYWSSTLDGSGSRGLALGNNDAFFGTYDRARGVSVRCLKDESVQPTTYNLILNINPEVAGTVSGEDSYEEGSAVSLTATANEGYSFVNWTQSEDTISETAAFTYTMPAINVNLTANFEEIVEEGEVYNPSTGKIWMDRNLGASRVANSSTDAEAYGDLYQWGRGTDGHQIRTSGTTSTLATNDTPGHGSFIISPDSPGDWRSPQNDDLWQGVNGTNNPCPSGYRLPTIAELDAERQSWGSNNAAGAFASPLKLPVAGGRYYGSGSLSLVGSYGLYWSSTVDGSISRSLNFSSSVTGMFYNDRANGFSVRCLKD